MSNKVGWLVGIRVGVDVVDGLEVGWFVDEGRAVVGLRDFFCTEGALGRDSKDGEEVA